MNKTLQTNIMSYRSMRIIGTLLCGFALVACNQAGAPGPSADSSAAQAASPGKPQPPIQVSVVPEGSIAGTESYRVMVTSEIPVEDMRVVISHNGEELEQSFNTGQLKPMDMRGIVLEGISSEELPDYQVVVTASAGGKSFSRTVTLRDGLGAEALQVIDKSTLDDSKVVEVQAEETLTRK
ncbi:MAG: hypothetical protein R3217_02280 [Gammaproteobacteria bacterium]|nr:hypothetical protein [Gammaproteobacteria bacterium]